jgi:Uncharacterized conserved protein (DUF2340)
MEPTPYELLANELKPLTDSTLTIRVIKSFKFRNVKNLVLKDLNLTELTIGELKKKVLESKKI